MATEFAISKPMAQRLELAFGCCLGVGSSAQAAHFRAHPTVGASTLARKHASRPKKAVAHTDSDLVRVRDTDWLEWAVRRTGLPIQAESVQSPSPWIARSTASVDTDPHGPD